VAGFSLAGHEAVQVVVSMAGGISTGQWPAFRAMLAGLGINQEPAMKSDLLGNFCSGTPELSGYVLDAGTGSGAVRIEDGVSSRTADGLGWLLGDAGSGFWIGSQAVRAAFADVDGRGPATRLTDLVFARLGLDFVRAGTGQNQTEGRPAVTLEGLRLIYELAPIELSRFASAAFEAAGDQVADAIVDRAIGQLAGTMRAVLRPEITGPVVLAGGVLTANRGFRDRLIERLRPDLPQATFLPVADGMVGALMLALRQAGLEAGPERFDRLSRTLAALPSRGTQLRVTPPLAPQP
jgi:N-acetylglucosamine kinase-like BadF-type ATPase